MCFESPEWPFSKSGLITTTCKMYRQRRKCGIEVDIPSPPTKGREVKIMIKVRHKDNQRFAYEKRIYSHFME